MNKANSSTIQHEPAAIELFKQSATCPLTNNSLINAQTVYWHSQLLWSHAGHSGLFAFLDQLTLDAHQLAHSAGCDGSL